MAITFPILRNPFPLSGDTYSDLVRSTQNAYPLGDEIPKFQLLNRYPMVKRMLLQGTMDAEPGASMAWHAQIAEGGNYQVVGPGSEVKYNISDVLGDFQAPWALAHGDYGFFRDELTGNGGATRIVNLRRHRVNAALDGMYNNVEFQSWGLPVPKTDPTEQDFLPITHSISPLSASQVAAINAAILTGTTQTTDGEIVGPDSTGDFYPTVDSSGLCYGRTPVGGGKYARHVCYNDVWPTSTFTCSENDINRIIRLLDHCQWDSPIDADEFKKSRMNKAIYVTYAMKSIIGQRSRSSNDGFKGSLGMFSDEMNIQGIPFVWSPAMQKAASTNYLGTASAAACANPMVCVDHTHLKLAICDGEKLKEDAAKQLEKQPRMTVVDIWLKGQVANINRRTMGAIMGSLV